jgi:hypothetical protein
MLDVNWPEEIASVVPLLALRCEQCPGASLIADGGFLITQ